MQGRMRLVHNKFSFPHHNKSGYIRIIRILHNVNPNRFASGIKVALDFKLMSLLLTPMATHQCLSGINRRLFAIVSSRDGGVWHSFIFQLPSSAYCRDVPILVHKRASLLFLIGYNGNGSNIPFRESFQQQRGTASG